MKPTIKLTLQFDGTDFHGWQRQATLPTVQGELERALAAMFGEAITTYGCSRTDAGVHAEAHVSHFHATREIPEHGILRGLNSLLPPGIAVQRVERVPGHFSAKRSSVFKVYRYQIYPAPVRSPIHRRFAWHLVWPLSVESMARGGEVLCGEHDFSSFRAAGCDARSPVRYVHHIRVERRGDLLCLEVKGNAFLRQMVRNIVGTLVEVGRGRQPADWVAEVLAARDRNTAGPTAPAHGLFLQHVEYHPDYREPTEFPK